MNKPKFGIHASVGSEQKRCGLRDVRYIFYASYAAAATFA